MPHPVATRGSTRRRMNQVSQCGIAVYAKQRNWEPSRNQAAAAAERNQAGDAKKIGVTASGTRMRGGVL